MSRNGRLLVAGIIGAAVALLCYWKRIELGASLQSVGFGGDDQGDELACPPRRRARYGSLTANPESLVGLDMYLEFGNDDGGQS